jgi:ribosome-associated translation inhibitor RaiA
MQKPIQIVLKNIERPQAVREQVRAAAAALEKFHARITSCRVSVTNPDTRHAKGALFDVHVALTVPGGRQIAVSRRAGDQAEREHLPVALRKAFAQIRRRLQDTARELRGELKTPVGRRPPAAKRKRRKAETRTAEP